MVVGLSDVQLWFDPNADELGIEIGCNGICVLGVGRTELKRQVALIVMDTVDLSIVDLSYSSKSCMPLFVFICLVVVA